MVKALPLASESSHTDANQQFSLIAVQGTLGTSDIGGTAPTVPLGANAQTGALFVQDLSGATGTTNIQGSVQITGGTLNAGTFTNLGTNVNIVTGSLVGTLLGGTLQAGTVVIPSGTINVGTFTNLGTNVNIVTGSLMGTILGGTINALASGTITGGTIQNVAGGTVISPMPSGTLNVGTVVVTLGTVGGAAANAAAASGNPNPVGGTDSGGTIRTIFVDSTGIQRSTGSVVMTVGTLTTGTLQNLVTGTINALAAGTITAGTLTNLVSGTVNALAAGTITGGTLGNLNAGTITSVAEVVKGTTTLVSTVTTVSNLTNGSVNLLTGTVTSITNLAGGTVQLNQVPVVVGTSYGTLGTTGALVWGTLVAAAGAGTKQYVSGIGIVVMSGTVDCAITNVGTIASPQSGNGVLARGNFPAGGGISENFFPVIPSGTNGTLAYFMGGAGTAYFTIRYWNGV